MGPGKNNIIVVIRAAGERTVAACRELVLKQVPAGAMEVVNEFPFEKALRRTYEIGIQRATKWTMTLDADVLLREGAIEQFLAEAEALPQSFLQVEGLVHDKLTGLYRQCGHRIYRTEYLQQALLQIASAGTEIRPEDSTIRRMAKLGFPSRRIDLVVGIHDYEQYYRDIYRKTFVHANKHQIWLADMVSRWKQLMPEDADFRIALRGLYDGLMSVDMAKIDARRYSDAAAAAMQDLKLQEKPELDGPAVSFDFVAAQLKDAGIPPQVSRNARQSFRYKMQDTHARIGTLRMVPFLIGTGLHRAGEWLKRKADLGFSHKDN